MNVQSESPKIYRRLFRFGTSQGVPSTVQLAHGVPEIVTVHLTLRELHALHAIAARLIGRDVRAGEDIVV
jgi:hypothetical protein